MEFLVISKQMIYAVPDKFSLKKFGALLSDDLKVKIETVSDSSRFYLDTFDWRLFRSGMVLEIEDRGGLCLLTWRELRSGWVLLSRTVRRPPKKAADFSDAGMQSKLKQVLGRRTLLAHACLNGNTERLLLLNEDEKILMRVELRRDHVISPINNGHLGLDAAIYIFSYRGYEKLFNDRLKCIEDSKLSPIAEDPLVSAMNAIDVMPGEYVGRPDFPLEPKQHSIYALVDILNRFLQIIECNAKGASEDEDPEYLHDFLVALRRTSSFIYRFSAVFPGNNLKLIEDDFHWIEQELTPIRDLDIYMSLFNDFESRVDTDHRQALKSLYSFLQSQKQQELRRMRVSLESTRYFRLIESWSQFLKDCKDADELPAAAQSPIGDIARDCIWSIYRELVQKAKNISSNTKADDICDLHQTSKRLGYHMDVFKSLFPAKSMARLIDEHSRLQQCLNQFRDMNLQYSRLRSYKAKMGQVQAVRAISLEAVEQLIVDRKNEKRKARKQVISQIDSFTRKKIRKHFKSTLSMPIKGGGK